MQLQKKVISLGFTNITLQLNVRWFLVNDSLTGLGQEKWNWGGIQRPIFRRQSQIKVKPFLNGAASRYRAKYACKEVKFCFMFGLIIQISSCFFFFFNGILNIAFKKSMWLEIHWIYLTAWFNLLYKSPLIWEFKLESKKLEIWIQWETWACLLDCVGRKLCLLFWGSYYKIWFKMAFSQFFRLSSFHSEVKTTKIPVF